jgi:hypothetical protein
MQQGEFLEGHAGRRRSWDRERVMLQRDARALGASVSQRARDALRTWAPAVTLLV